MLNTCKIFLYPSDKKGKDSKNYLKYQRECVNKILNDVMQREFQIDYSKAMIEKDKYGKPFLKDFPYIHYNVSHCDGFIACGISGDSIGIDIENVREYPDKVITRVFSLKERESVECAVSKKLKFFQFWTLKESYIKAIGKGLSFPIDQLFFEILDTGEIKCNQDNGYFKQILFNDSQFVLSVCTLKESKIEIEFWNTGGRNE